MKRIQRKRTKGWKMPPQTLYVGRGRGPGEKWANPFRISDEISHAEVLALYRVNTVGLIEEGKLNLDELAEYDALACWCALDQPCHADVLIDLLTTCSACGDKLDDLAQDDGRGLMICGPCQDVLADEASRHQ